MNTKTWMTTVLAAVAIGLSLTGTPAFAGQGYAVGKTRPATGIYDYARVVSAEPVIRYVTVTTPVKECWEEMRQYTVVRRPNTAGGTILGAIIGGVIGHQFGSGHGNDAATVAGTLIGAAIGNNASRRNAYAKGEYGSTQYSRPVQRCETTYRQHEEERIDGYRVVYKYHGQKYATQMPYNPGDRIRIRVDVRPAGR